MGQRLLINELQPTNRSTISTDGDSHPDWVELVSRSSSPLVLDGYILSLGARSHTLTSPLVLRPGEHLLLWFDERTELGPTHVALKLPKEGGTLLLIAPDHRTILDLFTWAPLPADISIGRVVDNKGAWCLFEAPTPGAPNGMDTGSRSITEAPVLSLHDGRLHTTLAPGVSVRYTTDGSQPRYSDPPLENDLMLEPGTVLRASAWTAASLPGPETMITVPTIPEQHGYISIAAWNADLYNAESGILSNGESANFSRSGKDWQIPALVEFQRGDEHVVMPLGLAVAGSGSRGLPKRSFKLLARERFSSTGNINIPGQGAWDEALLRADAGPHAYLRNVFMDRVAVRTGSNVDVQQGLPFPLYLNGAYQGLYRLLPPKNGDRFVPAGGGGAIDLVEGPAARALRGRSDGYVEAVNALRAQAPMDSLSEAIELNSLIDLACFDLYTGRADHDLNVRAWRPRTAEGQWRWMLFDMDLWSPPTENSVERMCSATAAEAPYLPALLAHQALAPLLIARLEALLLTVLSPAEATPLVDSIASADHAALARDHALWSDTLERPSPDQALAALHEHLLVRPGNLIDQLADHTGHGLATITFEGPPSQQGVLLIEDLPLRERMARSKLLKDVPLHVVASAAEGWEFAGWKGMRNASPVMDVLPGRIDLVSPQFRKAMVRP